MPEASRERLHSLDALRGGALLMGVALHGAMPYVPSAKAWILQDAQSQVLPLFCVVTHMFRMLLFFVIAGFFGRLMLERRGTAGFAGDRAKRILLPFLVFWPVILGLERLAFHWGAELMHAAGRTDGALPAPISFTFGSIPLTHLWFLYLLTFFYVGAVILRRLATAAATARTIALGEQLFRRTAGSPLALIAVAAPLLLVLILRSNWIPGFGIPTPDSGLFPNLAAFVGYGSAFLFGWLLEPHADVLQTFQRRWISHLAIAAALTGVCIGLYARQMTAPNLVERALFAASYALAAWAWVLGLLGFAKRFLAAEQPQVRYVADASYWIYIVHLPVVMALQLLVFPLPWPALAKFAVATGGALALLLASYALLVRGTWLGAWLNGRRRPAGLRHRAALMTDRSR